MNHDQLFKLLITAYFWEFVELFLPDMLPYLDRSLLEFVDKEAYSDLLGGERSEADLVVKVRFRGSGAFFLVHVENQASAQSGFARRMFRYFSLLHGKYNLPVYPVAVLSFDQPLRKEPNRYVVSFPTFPVLTFQFRTIQLNRLDWRKFLAHPNPVAAALMSKMRIAKKDRARVKLACLQMIAAVEPDPAGRELLSGIVDVYLPLDAAELREFHQGLESSGLAEKEGVMEIVTSWMREGVQKGLAQGRQEGAAEMALRFLRRRLGALPEPVEKRVRRLHLDRVEALGDALPDIHALSDLEAWLASNG